MKEKKGSGKGKAGIIAALAVLAIIVLCFGTIVNFVTDYWWFKDLGYTQVFFTKLFTEIKIAIPAFVITFILSRLYLTTLRREYMKKLETVEGHASDKSIKRFTMLISAIFSVIITFLLTTSLWQQILYSMNSTEFNVEDQTCSDEQRERAFSDGHNSIPHTDRSVLYVPDKRSQADDTGGTRCLYC